MPAVRGVGYGCGEETLLPSSFWRLFSLALTQHIAVTAAYTTEQLFCDASRTSRRLPTYPVGAARIRAFVVLQREVGPLSVDTSILACGACSLTGACYGDPVWCLSSVGRTRRLQRDW